MTKREIKTLIENNESFQEFLYGEKGSMRFNVSGVTILIYKEDRGASYYYRLPWHRGAKYNSVSTFMKHAIPLLSEMIEEKRLDNLIAPNNVIKATLRTL